jgi:ABC-2 type transport system permease protein
LRAVFLKEVATYFKTMLGYVFIGVFLFFSGLVFNLDVIMAGSGSVPGLFGDLFFALVLLTPFLTMRLISEETKAKSDVILLTSPVPLTSIVLGKFLAACLVLLISMAATLVYVLIIGIFGSLSVWEVLLGYAGYFLLAGVCISIGLFVSTLAENQLSSVLATFVVLLLLWMPRLVRPGDETISSLLNAISIFSHYTSFQFGLLSMSSVLYMLSFSFVFLFLTIRVIEGRRWAKG